MSRVIEPGPAVVSPDAVKTSIKVEPLTCTIGAELANVNLGVASRDSGSDRRNSLAAAQVQGAVFPRPGHHARRACRLRAALRRA